MKLEVTHKLKAHDFTLEISSKESGTIIVDVKITGCVYVTIGPKNAVDHDLELFDSIQLKDLVKCIVYGDAFIKRDVESFQKKYLWKIDYSFDDIKVQSFIDNRGNIVWNVIVNKCLVDSDASSPAVMSEYLDYKEPMHGNDIKFQPRMKVCMTYTNFIGLLSAVYFSDQNKPSVDTDDDVEDHDDNLRAYTKTPYTEESMAKIRMMAGHNTDNED